MDMKQESTWTEQPPRPIAHAEKRANADDTARGIRRHPHIRNTRVERSRRDRRVDGAEAETLQEYGDQPTCSKP